jgi:hypothetical protein
MTPRYFFANATLAGFCTGETIRPEFLAAYGLHWAWRDVTEKGQCAVYETERGPGNQPGLFVWLHPGKELLYRPGKQDWQECECSPPPHADGRSRGVWLAIDAGQSVMPDDLRRAKPTDGYNFVPYEELGPLVVPIIRSPRRDRIQIPQRMHHAANGQIVLTVREQWLWLWESVGRAWDVLTGQGEPFGMAEGLQLALDVLGVNYRYSRYEQERLGWLDTNNWLEPLYLATDVGILRELQAADELQKKTADSPAVASMTPEPGSPAACPSIDPAAASSISLASPEALDQLLEAAFVADADDENSWSNRHARRSTIVEEV